MDFREITENGQTYWIGQTVERLDYEQDGTAPVRGTLARIVVDDDETTYWIQWDGATAADAHGTYAFRVVHTNKIAGNGE